MVRQNGQCLGARNLRLVFAERHIKAEGTSSERRTGL